MMNEILIIEQYLNTIHDHTILKKPHSIEIKEINNKVPLDMKILQNRLDSASVVKYYKDLKNDRIKVDKKIEFADSIDDIEKRLAEVQDNKPWVKLDRYTKMQKIQKFVNSLTLEDKKSVLAELIKMLDEKRIHKKNMELDENNNIVRIGNYNNIENAK